MSRVVVTGGSGFLGSHLCEALLARGDQVVCVDDLSTGNLENIRHLRSDDGFEFINKSLGFDEDVDLGENTIDEFTDKLDVDGSMKFAMYDPAPSEYGAYVGYVATGCEKE